MATLKDMMARFSARTDERLAFKELALKHCNHSKRREKLERQVKGLRELSEMYEKYRKDDDE